MRSDWHFGRDYDMRLYPPVKWEPDYYYEPPEPIEAADIQGTLLINADDAIEQVRKLQAENAKLRELVRDLHKALFTLDIDHCQACSRDNINGPCTKFAPWGNDECSIEEVMRELGIEVKE